ncbi:HPP family protein [Paenibacillus sp. GCM10027626]|uniref:CBS domain-containing protein n=1 Tax=Paenibacillus sp. GCM10027626 TaxID=3273411 RepID=UPI003628942F
MQAADIMNRQVVRVKEDEPLSAVLSKLLEHQMNVIPVVNERNEIRGMIGVADILRWVGKHHTICDFIYFSGVWMDQEALHFKVDRLFACQASDLINPKVIIVQMDDELEEVVTLLGRTQSNIVLVENDGVLQGSIEAKELIRFILNDVDNRYH